MARTRNEDDLAAALKAVTEVFGPVVILAPQPPMASGPQNDRADEAA